MSGPAPLRLYRSVLYVPATNAKALTKVAQLACDAVIVDLEDAVAPSEKDQAREALASWHAQRAQGGPPVIVRINALSTEWGAQDLKFAGELEPDAILLPKVGTPRDVLEAGDALDEAGVADEVGLWAMIETPRAMLNIGAIAELGRDPASRLGALVAGSNDLARETRVATLPDRRYLLPWLMQIVLAARAGGLVALDGVMNDFRDAAGLARECEQGAAMGFDGKTLIHPSQIEPANAAFSASPEALAEAQRIIDTFALPENADRGVVAIDGRMTERLHLSQARDLVARAAAARSNS